MRSTVCGLAGFACFAVAAYFLAGLVAVLLVVGVELLILELALDESHRSRPERPTLVRRPRSRPQRVVPWDEPMTNADFDREMAAMAAAAKPNGDSS